MSTETLGGPASAADRPFTEEAGLLAEIRRMGSVIWRSAERNRLLLLCAALILVIAGTAYMQIRLNAWNRPFYDALTHKDLAAFLRQLGVFAQLAAILLLLNVSQCGSTRPPGSPCAGD
jgi:putative ATP-binding cassette transporter